MSEGLPMRESPRRDGCVALHPNDDDSDFAIVEPIVVGFVPRALHCGYCGAPLRSWDLQRTDEGAGFICHRCHHELGVLELGAKVHHG
jgi:hypothetical protein